jgi:hypothetical protein
VLNGKALLSSRQLLVRYIKSSQWHSTVFGSTSPILTNILEKENSCERSVCPDVLMLSRDEDVLIFYGTDFFILTFCCLSYFTNYLDRSNLANAYVSGMKEELGFKGNQYNQINTVFTVG